MKKMKFVSACLLSLALLFPSFSTFAQPLPQPLPDQRSSEEMRGLWVATVYNIDYPSKATTDPAILKSEAIAILDKAQVAGLNAVFLQVRPTADAFYKSSIFPWSKYLTGKQGTAPLNEFDPLVFWIEEAHKRGLELHAWINPYRITKKGTKDPNHDFNALATTHPARLHPEWVVKHTDGNLYFNPGIPEVRQLIVDSAMELVQNYPIDGIHFDDYFYPGTSFADEETYKTYGKGYLSIHDWRRENVNILIWDLSTAIRNTDKPTSFGISPFGIWANKASNSLGSDTKGLQSYYDHYADTRKWVKEGSIDYIAPQLYWNIGYSIADYAKLLTWWSDVVKGTSVKLYIGHGAYRVGNTDPKSPWVGVDEIGRQLKLNHDNGFVSGSLFYNYTALKKYPNLVSLIASYYQKAAAGSTTPTFSYAVQTDISFARPSGNISTNLGTYFICGASNPMLPLLVNGLTVDSRSSKGYFGYFATLKEGVNTFVFTQGAVSKTLVLTKGRAVSQAAPMKTIEIPATSVFPQVQEARQAGEKITLSCQAPIGSSVSVKLNGTSYAMVPKVSKTSAKGAYATTYTYGYTIPSFTGNPRNVNLGKPVYSMKYGTKSNSRTAPSGVSVIMEGSPYYAKVLEAVVDTYQTPTTSNGAAAEIYKGMIDKVTGVTGSYVRLASGLWVKKENTSLYSGDGQFKGKMNSAFYQVGEKRDSVYFELSHLALTVPSFDGTTLRFDVSGVTNVVPLELPEGSLFSQVESTWANGKASYRFTLKEGVSLEGYSVNATNKAVVLDLKRKPKLSPIGLPLQGISVLIDPGHGGSDPGAIGPLGKLYSEKHINLALGLKLENALKSLGATVEMTRRIDIALGLSERLAISRQMKPDLFISVHANSVADSSDINKIYGFSVYYKESTSKSISQQILQSVVTGLGRNDRGINVRNFYVTRGSWAPSLLIEAGFVPNPVEFEWLTDDNAQTQFAAQMASAILAYFAQ